jgi:addiction module HigA family antidote
MLPKNREPFHPGEILSEEFLTPLEITQARLADELNMTRAQVSEICNGKRGITPKTALKLSDAFGTTPEYWLNGQRNYDLWVAMQDHEPIKRFSEVA